MRTIGEVTRALGIRQHVLRYWEEQFPMLKPVKRSGGRRYYRPEDVALVAQIDRLVHHEGYTLRGARLALEGKGKSPAAEDDTGVAPEAAVMSEQVRAKLQSLRDELASALRHA
ncbi:MerR family transcriptional regulator [Novosphingobium aquimarinum]|uniref:MerR family transcriptional regulator n=1 Tax=Novosphingobium aquimarinum TaxID=2682494 RepID=UPI0012ECA4DA|nr:MerR family transcriptional regulator [Novosphingobium aquimarinum]